MQRRAGFTLIEMMVAMALTVFVMVILSQAFVTGLETFRQLKAIGDMQESLRTATMRLRDDLSLDHFEGKRRLSDPYFWTEGKPREGFIRIVQATSPTTTVSLYMQEGTDFDGLPSYRAANHVLHFSVKARGNRKENFFSAAVPSGSPLLTVATTFFNQAGDARFQESTATYYNSQWAEVAYYLDPIGSTIEPNNPTSTLGTPLYTLYRVQRLVVPDSNAVNNPPAPTLPVPNSDLDKYAELSCQAGSTGLVFNTPADLANSQRAFSSGSAALGRSPVLSNVVSFQVRPLLSTVNDFGDLPGSPPTAFDTNASASPGYTVNALQITLRVWDVKTLQSRQITLVQDL